MNALTITYYTDPLCCWSWAMEPVIRKIKYEFGQQIKWRYCMGGFIPAWKLFQDPVNNVSRPLQMGPVWMHASQISGMPMDQLLWYKDPPASSYPACIAFECVQLQSSNFAESYLRLIREACMLRGINIAKKEHLTVAARELTQIHPEFDINLFLRHLNLGAGLTAFKAGLAEIKSKNISRFPTFIFRCPGKTSLISVGYRPYQSFLHILSQLSPDIRKSEEPIKIEEYKSYWPTLTERELKEIEPAAVG